MAHLLTLRKQYLKNGKNSTLTSLYIPLEERTTHDIRKQYPQKYRTLLDKIRHSEDFHLSLEPIEGGIEALKEMKKLGIEVKICSSPATNYRHCVREKYEWVERHFGKDWTGNIILTEDKTLIIGDYLIDDAPEIKGIRTPIWEHIIFEQPYNKNVKEKKDLTGTTGNKY